MFKLKKQILIKNLDGKHRHNLYSIEIEFIDFLNLFLHDNLNCSMKF